MEENKFFMPPPPKELKNMPPPPPPKINKVEERHEEIKIELQKPVVEINNTEVKESVDTSKFDTYNFEKMVRNPLQENKINVVEKEKASDVELVEKETKIEKNKEKQGSKNSSNLKITLYWIGFVVSLGAVGAFIYLLLM